MPKWRAFKKWKRKYLQKAFGSNPVIVGDYSMNFGDFLTYMDSNADDMPLYLFDKTFTSTAPQLANDYQVISFATYKHKSWAMIGSLFKTSGSIRGTSSLLTAYRV